MICVDASVAVKWVLAERFSDRADALYASALASREAIVAPPLMPFEVTNVIRQQLRRQEISFAQATAALTRFFSFSVELRRPQQLHLQTLTIADQFGLPAAYDAHYIALAESLRCDVWTDDQRLVRSLSGGFPFVRWIGDYSSDHATT